MEKVYYSNGKLLLTGEYVVLDGAKALAVPTSFGQSLKVISTDENLLHWKSHDETGTLWYEDTFNLKTFNFRSNRQESKTLQKILLAVRKQNPNFLKTGAEVKTHLTFPRKWGLGSSSTLINNIADWASVNPYQLLDEGFGGSGYDIAAAKHNKPITYIRNKTSPLIKEILLNWPFTDQLFFVYLNVKKQSKEAIVHYRNFGTDKKVIEKISEITEALIHCLTLDEFEKLLTLHEKHISSILKTPTIKNLLFPDYSGIVKSLGGWGGDFVLATGNEENKAYFRKKGYHTIISFQEMVKSTA